MNRIVLIGNGFDLAHGFKTSYPDFINWYWDNRVKLFHKTTIDISQDILCTFRIRNGQAWSVLTYGETSFWKYPGKEIIECIRKDNVQYETIISPFLENIIESIDTKGWADIESEYYKLLTEYSITNPSDENLKELNEQLAYIQDMLVKYLNIVCQEEIKPKFELKRKLYEPINTTDISVEWQKGFVDYLDWCMNQDIDYWKYKLAKYGDKNSYADIEDYKKYNSRVNPSNCPRPFLLPDNVLFVNFNYTNTADYYLRENISSQIHIHGELSKPESIIFGYGDEMDEKYKMLQNLNNNECLQKIKSIKYLESDNYRNILRFVDSAPFQIYIMGHSCGNSDRTLLNTLFEHRNCISIKPYFYIDDKGKNHYLDVVQNISRNFNDMKLMRDRVVNKMYCEELIKSPK